MYSNQQEETARFAKVFGHPARIAILQQLFEIDTCYCGDLSEVIGLAQPTISQHLKELKHAGLIKGTVDGTRVCYCIDSQNWAKMKQIMHEFLDQGVPKADCC